MSALALAKAEALERVASAAKRLIGDEAIWYWFGGKAVCSTCEGVSPTEIVADIRHESECPVGALEVAVVALDSLRIGAE